MALYRCIGAGLAEPFFGTVCLFHMERKEKIYEDYRFQCISPQLAGQGGEEGG